MPKARCIVNCSAAAGLVFDDFSLFNVTLSRTGYDLNSGSELKGRQAPLTVVISQSAA